MSAAISNWGAAPQVVAVALDGRPALLTVKPWPDREGVTLTVGRAGPKVEIAAEEWAALLAAVGGHTSAATVAPVMEEAEQEAGEATSETEEAGREADVARDALEAVYEHVAARATQTWGRHEERADGTPAEPHGGWLGAWPETPTGAWALAVRAETVERVLAERGFAVGVIDRWRERQWLAVERQSVRKQVRINRARIRCYAFTRLALAQLPQTGSGDIPF